MLDVDVHEAEVIITEGALALSRPVCAELYPAVQALGLEDTPDAVAVEVRQEVANNEGQVIEREVGAAAQGADDGALFLGCLPRQFMRPGGPIEAVRGTALAPLAYGLAADAVTPGDSGAGLSGTCDFGAGGGRGAGIRVDVQHGSPLS
jgi:hypothetical protein